MFSGSGWWPKKPQGYCIVTRIALLVLRSILGVMLAITPNANAISSVTKATFGWWFHVRSLIRNVIRIVFHLRNQRFCGFFKAAGNSLKMPKIPWSVKGILGVLKTCFFFILKGFATFWEFSFYRLKKVADYGYHSLIAEKNYFHTYFLFFMS